MHIGKIGSTDVVLYGRTLRKNQNTGFSWSASGFSAEFKGTRVVCSCLADGDTNEKNKPYFGVYVDDGEISLKFCVDKREWQEIVLAKDLTEGFHKISVIKLTESSIAPVMFQSLNTDGEFLQPKVTKLPKIEVIGDSIACGYGIECSKPDGEFNSNEENVTKSFTYIAAKKLGADITVIAHSGWAVYMSPYGGSMADCYDKVDSVAGCDEYIDFSEKPDVLISALGTNDNAWIGDEQEEKTPEFKKHYLLFIEKLRKIYPDTPIICVIGMASIRNDKAINDVVDKATASGITNVYYCKLPQTRVICALHPCEECHKEAADVLINKILAVSDKFCLK